MNDSFIFRPFGIFDTEWIKLPNPQVRVSRLLLAVLSGSEDELLNPDIPCMDN